MKVLRIIDK